MKQEIEKIIREYLVTDVYSYYGPDDSEDSAKNQLDKAVSQILNLFPKWRVPSVDGWPKEDTDLLFVTSEGQVCCGDYTEHLNYFRSEEGFEISGQDIKYWLPVSEFLKIMEVNK